MAESYTFSQDNAMQRTMSCCGIPSVMTTTSGISFSIASMAAAMANGGGT